MLKSLFYISNSPFHKIINILGIKIKLSLKRKIKKHGFFVFGCENKIIKIINNAEKSLTSALKGLDIEIKGDNNCVILKTPAPHFKNCKLIIYGNNNLIEIGSSEHLIENTIFDMRVIGEKRTIKIGENFSSNGAVIWCEESCSNVIIGNDVMFGHNIFIRNSDGHIIFDKDGNHINKANKIEIHDHVWIGAFVSVLKNVEIPKNSIIGTHSLVTKTIKDENCIIAGIPAKIIRRDISWLRMTPNVYYAQLEEVTA